MKSKAVISAILAISLSSTSLAFAQRNGDRNDRGRNQQQDERGAGPDHAFHRGERLPAENRHRQYVVDDWRGHNLSSPPRGYHWVQTGSDYVLVAIATGIIAQLLLGR